MYNTKASNFPMENNEISIDHLFCKKAGNFFFLPRVKRDRSPVLTENLIWMLGIQT